MNHLADIGFEVKNPGELAHIFSELKDVSKKQIFGKYIQYVIEDQSGARLYWICKKTGLFRKKEEFVSFIPAFKCDSFQSIRALKLKPNLEFPLEPSLDLWISDSELEEEYPLIVDIANYLEVQNQDFTKLDKIQTALFVNSFEHYESEDAFGVRYPKRGKVQFPSPQMFVPSGTFPPKNDPRFIPHAEGFGYGKVIKAEKLVNQITGKEFYHFTMKTYAATYDVVAQIEEDIDLTKVQIIGGNFWPCTIL